MYRRFLLPTFQAALYIGKQLVLFSLTIQAKVLYIQHADDRKLVRGTEASYGYGCSHFSLKMTGLPP